MSNNEQMERRMLDLERRVKALEDAKHEGLWGARSPETMRREEALLARYGEFVDKTVAAKILGVTRQTVYAMLTDGRISGACDWRRVDVRSIARYQASDGRLVNV